MSATLVSHSSKAPCMQGWWVSGSPKCVCSYVGISIPLLGLQVRKTKMHVRHAAYSIVFVCLCVCVCLCPSDLCSSSLRPAWPCICSARRWEHLRRSMPELVLPKKRTEPAGCGVSWRVLQRGRCIGCCLPSGLITEGYALHIARSSATRAHCASERP